VYENPADTFVATFLGSPPMNLVARDGQLLGFRPESFLPSDLVPGDNGTKLTAELEVGRIEHLSGDRHVYGKVRGTGEETRVIARLPGDGDHGDPGGRRPRVRGARERSAVLRRRERQQDGAAARAGMTAGATFGH
jgi:ABC-type sugar transport system ATPase subunit